jgi:hypothetical protein
MRAMRYRELVPEATFDRAQSDPTWRTFVLDCGHHVMVDMPERLTEIMVEAGIAVTL